MLVCVGRNFRTQAGVHLIEGVLLIWGPLNTGFTVLPIKTPSPYVRFCRITNTNLTFGNAL